VRRREAAWTLLGLTGTALFIAGGAILVAVGVVMDEIAIARLMREHDQARGPANRDAREIGRTTDDDRGVW
jgi:hypothetical protein